MARANRCHTHCVQKDFSTNKLIFKPVHKDCKGCAYTMKRVLDSNITALIEEQKEREGKNNVAT